MKFSFVIPCYGSQKTITGVVDEIDQVMGMRPEFEYEIIAVNDCSPDSVLSVLRDLVDKNPHLTVADLSKNMGKHSAVMAGYSLASGDYIVNLDDDGQCPMDHLWKLYDAMGDKYDMAMAKYPEKKQSRFKNIGSAVNSGMTHWLLDKPTELNFSNFSIVKKYVIEEMLNYKNPYPYIEGLVLRTTRSIVCVDMEERERSDSGSGNFTFRKSLDLLINGLTAFSVKPLRIATLSGIASAFLGFLYGVYIIIHKLVHPETPIGYSSMMALLIFVGGMIMFMLGIIGEYIGRIYISINNSPQFVIREIIKNNDIVSEKAVSGFDD